MPDDEESTEATESADTSSPPPAPPAPPPPPPAAAATPFGQWMFRFINIIWLLCIMAMLFPDWVSPADPALQAARRPIDWFGYRNVPEITLEERAEAEKSTAATCLSAEMRGNCQFFKTAPQDWWTYAWCDGHEVEQRHTESVVVKGEKQQQKKETRTTRISLGKHDAVRSARLSLAPAASRPAAKEGEKGTLPPEAVMRTVQVYGDGSPCPAPGPVKQRRTLVQFVCCAAPAGGGSGGDGSGSGDAAASSSSSSSSSTSSSGARVPRIVSIVEAETCEYVLTVCSHCACDDGTAMASLGGGGDGSGVAAINGGSSMTDFARRQVAWDASTVRAVPVLDAERAQLQAEVKKMFLHGFNNYMDHAFPEDELKPLSCSGTKNLPDTAGKMLTLVDSLDTLAVFGLKREFRLGVARVCDKQTYDTTQNVSVFETTIRHLGGLLSAHLLAVDPARELYPANQKETYDGCLLRLATDLGYRMLPAFNTGTGVPYGTVNMRDGVPEGETPIASTAGGGSLLLEFAMLARLTGVRRFEDAARKALLALCRRKSKLGLLGLHIHTETGAWTETMAGIGSNADSVYEYLYKAHLLFDFDDDDHNGGAIAAVRKRKAEKMTAVAAAGERPGSGALDEAVHMGGNRELWHHFVQLYTAVLRHVRQLNSPWYATVNMEDGRPAVHAFNNLQAFWPGLQVMLGHFTLATGTLRAFHAVWQEHGFTPEDFDYAKWKLFPHAHRSRYPLRPELAESTFLMYQASREPSWLSAGREMVTSLRKTRARCGHGGVKHVAQTPIVLEDAMPSFFLGETLKYLYLLFDDGTHWALGAAGAGAGAGAGQGAAAMRRDYIFTTEAHLFPTTAALSRPWSKRRAAALAAGLDAEKPESLKTTSPYVVPPPLSPLKTSLQARQAAAAAGADRGGRNRARLLARQQRCRPLPFWSDVSFRLPNPGINVLAVKQLQEQQQQQHGPQTPSQCRPPSSNGDDDGNGAGGAEAAGVGVAVSATLPGVAQFSIEPFFAGFLVHDLTRKVSLEISNLGMSPAVAALSQIKLTKAEGGGTGAGKNPNPNPNQNQNQNQNSRRIQDPHPAKRHHRSVFIFDGAAVKDARVPDALRPTLEAAEDAARLRRIAAATNAAVRGEELPTRAVLFHDASQRGHGGRGGGGRARGRGDEDTDEDEDEDEDQTMVAHQMDRVVGCQVRWAFASLPSSTSAAQQYEQEVALMRATTRATTAHEKMLGEKAHTTAASAGKDGREREDKTPTTEGHGRSSALDCVGCGADESELSSATPALPTRAALQGLRKTEWHGRAGAVYGQSPAWMAYSGPALYAYEALGAAWRLRHQNVRRLDLEIPDNKVVSGLSLRRAFAPKSAWGRHWYTAGTTKSVLLLQKDSDGDDDGDGGDGVSSPTAQQGKVLPFELEASRQMRRRGFVGYPPGKSNRLEFNGQEASVPLSDDQQRNVFTHAVSCPFSLTRARDGKGGPAWTTPCSEGCWLDLSDVPQVNRKGWKRTAAASHPWGGLRIHAEKTDEQGAASARAGSGRGGGEKHSTKATASSAYSTSRNDIPFLHAAGFVPTARCAKILSEYCARSPATAREVGCVLTGHADAYTARARQRQRRILAEDEAQRAAAAKLDPARNRMTAQPSPRPSAAPSAHQEALEEFSSPTFRGAVADAGVAGAEDGATPTAGLVRRMTPHQRHLKHVAGEMLGGAALPLDDAAFVHTCSFAAFGPTAFGVMPAGPGLASGLRGARLVVSEPRNGCSTIRNLGPILQDHARRAKPHSHPEAHTVRPVVLLVERGGCMFWEKVLQAQIAGAAGVVVGRTEPGPAFVMSPGDATPAEEGDGMEEEEEEEAEDATEQQAASAAATEEEKNAAGMPTDETAEEGDGGEDKKKPKRILTSDDIVIPAVMVSARSAAHLEALAVLGSYGQLSLVAPESPGAPYPSAAWTTARLAPSKKTKKEGGGGSGSGSDDGEGEEENQPLPRSLHVDTRLGWGVVLEPTATEQGVFYQLQVVQTQAAEKEQEQQQQQPQPQKQQDAMANKVEAEKKQKKKQAAEEEEAARSNRAEMAKAAESKRKAAAAEAARVAHEMAQAKIRDAASEAKKATTAEQLEAVSAAATRAADAAMLAAQYARSTAEAAVAAEAPLAAAATAAVEAERAAGAGAGGAAQVDVAASSSTLVEETRVDGKAVADGADALTEEALAELLHSMGLKHRDLVSLTASMASSLGNTDMNHLDEFLATFEGLSLGSTSTSTGSTSNSASTTGAAARAAASKAAAAAAPPPEDKEEMPVEEMAAREWRRMMEWLTEEGNHVDRNDLLGILVEIGNQHLQTLRRRSEALSDALGDAAAEDAQEGFQEFVRLLQQRKEEIVRLKKEN